MQGMQQQGMGMPAQPAMSAYGAPAGANIITTELIQKYLDENKQLILAILDNQNLGKLNECAQYQQRLQQNLMYLAAIADAQPQLPPPAGQAQAMTPQQAPQPVQTQYTPQQTVQQQQQPQQQVAVMQQPQPQQQQAGQGQQAQQQQQHMMGQGQVMGHAPQAQAMQYAPAMMQGQPQQAVGGQGMEGGGGMMPESGAVQVEYGAGHVGGEGTGGGHLEGGHGGGYMQHGGVGGGAQEEHMEMHQQQLQQGGMMAHHVGVGQQGMGPEGGMMQGEPHMGGM